MAASGRPDLPGGVIDEDLQWQRSSSRSAYACSNYLAELEVKRGIAEGLDAVLVNPSLIFGVGRRGAGTRRIIDRVRNGQLPAVPSGGTNVVDVLDVVEGVLRAMERGRTGERFFLGAENLSWREVIDILAEAFDVRSPGITLGRKPALALAYLIEGLSILTGRWPMVTREAARHASCTYRYENANARGRLDWRPRRFPDTARRIADELDILPAS